uniref:basic proline-rich protein-like n=1 Tax=Nyctereutes procyonoides TaxID=34880 RepID=UPI002443ACB6|nr:basic proline-rich protein-like [Nyctereutes procyonoides]
MWGPPGGDLQVGNLPVRASRWGASSWGPPSGEPPSEGFQVGTSRWGPPGGEPPSEGLQVWYLDAQVGGELGLPPRPRVSPAAPPPHLRRPRGLKDARKQGRGPDPVCSPWQSEPGASRGGGGRWPGAAGRWRSAPGAHVRRGCRSFPPRPRKDRLASTRAPRGRGQPLQPPWAAGPSCGRRARGLSPEQRDSGAGTGLSRRGDHVSCLRRNARPPPTLREPRPCSETSPRLKRDHVEPLPAAGPRVPGSGADPARSAGGSQVLPARRQSGRGGQVRALGGSPPRPPPAASLTPRGGELPEERGSRRWLRSEAHRASRDLRERPGPCAPRCALGTRRAEPPPPPPRAEEQPEEAPVQPSPLRTRAIFRGSPCAPGPGRSPAGGTPRARRLQTSASRSGSPRAPPAPAPRPPPPRPPRIPNESRIPRGSRGTRCGGRLSAGTRHRAGSPAPPLQHKGGVWAGAAGLRGWGGHRHPPLPGLRGSPLPRPSNLSPSSPPPAPSNPTLPLRSQRQRDPLNCLSQAKTSTGPRQPGPPGLPGARTAGARARGTARPASAQLPDSAPGRPSPAPRALSVPAAPGPPPHPPGHETGARYSHRRREPLPMRLARASRAAARAGS